MKVRLLLESEDIPLEFADSPVICQVWFPFSLLSADVMQKKKKKPSFRVWDHYHRHGWRMKFLLALHRPQVGYTIRRVYNWCGHPLKWYTLTIPSCLFVFLFFFSG